MTDNPFAAQFDPGVRIPENYPVSGDADQCFEIIHLTQIRGDHLPRGSKLRLRSPRDAGLRRTGRSTARRLYASSGNRPAD